MKHFHLLCAKRASIGRLCVKCNKLDAKKVATEKRKKNVSPGNKWRLMSRAKIRRGKVHEIYAVALRDDDT